MMRKLAYLARLGRLGMAPLTISVPVLGALAVGETPSPAVLFRLACIGLCAHLFGFSLNDLIDMPLDITLETRKGHPLITGDLSRWEAWLFTLLQVPLALGMYVFLLHGSGAGLVVLCLSIISSVIYNLWSKWGRLPRLLPELSLATSIGLLCLSGTWLNSQPAFSAGVIFVVALALVLLLLNSVPSGLKDLKTDSEFGVQSFVLSAGSRMLDADRMHISRVLQVYSAFVQMGIVVCVLLLFRVFHSSWIIILLSGLLITYGGLHLRMLLGLRSFAVLRRSQPLLNGYYNYSALSLLIIQKMPLWLQVFYGLLAFALLMVPLRMGYRVWRYRYDWTRGGDYGVISTSRNLVENDE